jgi:hypothetical protein
MADFGEHEHATRTRQGSGKTKKINDRLGILIPPFPGSNPGAPQPKVNVLNSLPCIAGHDFSGAPYVRLPQARAEASQRTGNG